MATLMSWGNSEGTKGRCDAKCQKAKSTECKCMCGGRYHGKANIEGGIERAVMDYSAEVIHAARERAKKEGFEIRFTEYHQDLAQPKLF